jgi:hypothetical protein
MPILLMLPLFLFVVALLVSWWLSDRFKFTYRTTGIVMLAAGTLLLLVGLCSVYFDWKEHSCPAGRTPFNTLPGPILLLTGFWLILAKRFRGAVKLAGLSLAIPLTAIMLFCISFQAYLGPHRSRISYKFFFSQYKDSTYKRVISHFPKKTPENAKAVRYFHQSHFMMGGMLLQLRYVLPKEEIESLLAESLGKAKQVQETDGQGCEQVRGDMSTGRRVTKL